MIPNVVLYETKSCELSVYKCGLCIPETKEL